MSRADVPISWSSGEFFCEWINANVQILVNCLLNTNGLLLGELTWRSWRSRSQAWWASQPAGVREQSAPLPLLTRWNLRVWEGQGEEFWHRSICSRDVLNVQAENTLRNPLAFFLVQRRTDHPEP